MKSDTPQPPEIGQIPPADYQQALALIFHRVPVADRQRHIAPLLNAAADNAAGLEGLWVARRGPRLVGAVLAQIQPGRTAAVWPPQLVDDEPETTAAGLLDEVCRFLSRRDVCLAQVLLEGNAQREAKALLQGGFQYLSELLYLVCPNSEFSMRPLATLLDFETYSAANHAQLAGIVEATYQQTRDCPQLNGARAIEDVLAGYRAAGVFDTSRWLIVRYQGADVGCLLLSDFPEYDNWELVYMGVVPSARGYGWGLQIVRWAQQRARQAGRQRLVLAVDAANEPAIRMYTEAGFQAWDRRTVYLKIFAAQRPTGSP